MVFITVEGGLEIPTAFTPNNDGFNDTWEIKNLDSYSAYKVSVYNGFGNQLYTTTDYQEPWDGNYEGSALPVGSYYFVIELTDNQGRTTVESGVITILR